MPLLKTIDILKACKKRKYAVGAFNINGLDQPSRLIKRAEELGSPLLIVVPGVIEKYVDFRDYSAVTMRAAADSKIPVGIHLSHADNLEQFERAAAAGFTSVMYDGSKLSYEENVRNTAEAVRIGHSYGAAVEGELGALGSSFANVSESMTDPSFAKDYVEKTGVDILAVAIGNAHGFYKGTPALDFNRLEEICNSLAKLNVFLTLHGGTGIPEEHIRRSIEMGITKICIYTEMCAVGKNKATDYCKNNPEYLGNYDVPELIKSITDGFIEAEEECMKMFMSVGKSNDFEKAGVLQVSLPKYDTQSISVTPSKQATVNSSVVLNTDIGAAFPSMDGLNPNFAGDKSYWNKNI